jgi:hypothetical protein
MEPVKSTMETKEPAVSCPSQEEHDTADDGKRPPPLLAKILAVFLISCISFGSHWSSGVTGAMKSTIKKVGHRSHITSLQTTTNWPKQMHVSNTQFSLLEASEDFMATVLMLISGVITDRIGGAGLLTPLLIPRLLVGD